MSVTRYTIERSDDAGTYNCMAHPNGLFVYASDYDACAQAAVEMAGLIAKEYDYIDKHPLAGWERTKIGRIHDRAKAIIEQYGGTP